MRNSQRSILCECGASATGTWKIADRRWAWCEACKAVVLPQAREAYSEAMRVYDVAHFEKVEAGRVAMTETGVKVGDVVELGVASWCGGGEVCRGVLRMRCGVPVVRFDRAVCTTRGYRKSVPWTRAWRKVTAGEVVAVAK